MNSELYDKKYKIPDDIKRNIQAALNNNPKGEGVKRAKYILRNGEITYQMMKRIKNFFDNYNGENQQEYVLSGGDEMRNYINSTLNKDRSSVELSNKIKSDVDYNSSNPVRTQKNVKLNENNDGSVNKNAIAVIVNDDKQILVMKRNPNIDMWEAGKWGLVGGTIEDGEDPFDACLREIHEETGIGTENIDGYKKKFEINRDGNHEYIYLIKYSGDPYNLNFNDEHVAYAWLLPEQMKYIDHVPNLMDYINIVFKNYN